MDPREIFRHRASPRVAFSLPDIHKLVKKNLIQPPRLSLEGMSQVRYFSTSDLSFNSLR
jgi:hypothetical protein